MDGRYEQAHGLFITFVHPSTHPSIHCFIHCFIQKSSLSPQNLSPIQLISTPVHPTINPSVLPFQINHFQMDLVGLYFIHFCHVVSLSVLVECLHNLVETVIRGIFFLNCGCFLSGLMTQTVYISSVFSFSLTDVSSGSCQQYLLHALFTLVCYG